MTLRQFRKLKRLTLQQVGLLLGGVHLSTVHRWETGERIPDAIDVAKIERLTNQMVRASSFTRKAGIKPAARGRRLKGTADATEGEASA